MSSVEADFADERGRARDDAQGRAQDRIQGSDQIVLRVLDAVERDPSVTQRSLSRELGIALGLTNTYLRRCVRKGLIKVGQVPARRFAYYLTPQGFAEKSRLTASYLSHSFSFFHSARVECDELYRVAVERGQRRLALLGGGDLADIASLVAREHAVEIAGIVSWSGEGGSLADGVAADGVIVTSLLGSQAAYDAACAAFGTQRVHVPRLLRVRTAAFGLKSTEMAS